MSLLQPPAVGDLVAGKYELVQSIGRGGMGLVFRATHRGLGQTVAIKFLHPETAADPELRRRFEREARVLGQIHAPHVVMILDVDELPNGLPYLVLEHLVGHDLEAELQTYRGAPLPVLDAVDYVHQAALGIIDAHALGVVHRDLKPSNLFLCDLRPASTRRMVKIVDFGISKLRSDTGRLTSTQTSFGTPLYMSPEQVRSASTVDERADIWALGAILFELLTGAAPFAREAASAVFAAIVADPLPDLSVLRPDLPRGLVAAISRALEKDPDARFATVRELAEALLPFAPQERIARVAASLRAPAYRPPQLTPAMGWHPGSEPSRDAREERPLRLAETMAAPRGDTVIVRPVARSSRHKGAVLGAALACALVTGAATMAIRSPSHRAEASALTPASAVLAPTAALPVVPVVAPGAAPGVDDPYVPDLGASADAGVVAATAALPSGMSNSPKAQTHALVTGRQPPPASARTIPNASRPRGAGGDLLAP